MIPNSPTLTWIQQTLGPWGFTLRDIIIIDAFPWLTDQDMEAMEDAEQLRLSNEVSNLTVKFLRRFQLPVISLLSMCDQNKPPSLGYCQPSPCCAPLLLCWWCTTSRGGQGASG
ncbi:hypothetical protein BDV12DRAFT_107151 [Aspergillus spectabilis]